jgi:hypothetical protein
MISQSKIKVMNKNETIELLEKQLPGFYSVDQVIELIKGIEGTNEIKFNIKALIEVIDDHIRDQMGGMNSDDACDFSTAEFSLNGNEIQLDCVDLEASNIADEATNGLEEVIEDFLKQQ